MTPSPADDPPVVTTPPQVAHAVIVRRLAETAGKSNRGAPAYTRWVNRPLGRQVAAVAFRWGRTPNQVTIANAAIIFPVLLLLAAVRPTFPWTSVAALLLLCGYVLDSADGQLARLRGGGSKAGEWLDHVVDACKTALVHVVLLVVWFRFYEFDDTAWLLVPIAFTVVHSTYFFALMLADDLRRIARIEGQAAASTHQREATQPEQAPLLRSFLVLPNDWGVLCIALLLLPLQWAFVIIYTTLLAAKTLFVVAGCARWYRELVTL